MKKFIISAISLAILLMAFACAEPSSTSDAGNSNNTPATPTNNTPESPTETTAGIPMSLVGTYTLVQYYKANSGISWTPEEEKLTLTISINADDTISYSGTQDASTADQTIINTIKATEFGKITFCSDATKKMKISMPDYPYSAEWTYSQSGNNLSITGYFAITSNTYNCEIKEMVIRK
ncbi:MAG: hypothetical protein IKQ61_07025 [Spirochaetales bacterium]|nr:hypothetical protein [Spirochaetales bacterium]